MYELVGVLKTIILELFIQQENNCQPRRISQMHNTLIQLHSGRIWTFGTFCTFCAKLIEWPPSIGKVSLATSRQKHNIIHHHYDFVISRCRFIRGEPPCAQCMRASVLVRRVTVCAIRVRTQISAASHRVRHITCVLVLYYKAVRQCLLDLELVTISIATGYSPHPLAVY